ncbi:hypothetical protein PENTCL1PPCAC_17103, partial [Pristionchus entomophagus]
LQFSPSVMPEEVIADDIVQNGREINDGMATIPMDDAPLMGDNSLQMDESQELLTPNEMNAVKRQWRKWERKLQENHPLIYAKYETCLQWWKYIGLGLLLLALLVFGLVWGFSGESQSPPPQLALCDSSLIPSITFSPANPHGTPRFWDNNIFLMPCKNALKFNQAILNQVNTRFEGGTWIKHGNESRINSTGGELTFMKTYIRFAIIVSRITDQSLSFEELAETFGKEFKHLKCFSVGRMNLLKDETSNFYRVCDEAEFSDSLNDDVNSTCTTYPVKCIRQLEMKILLFAMSFGEYKTEFKFVLTRNGSENSMNDFFSFADQNKRDDMVKFLNDAKADDFARMGKDLNSLFINMVDMMQKSDPKIGQDWSSYFGEKLHYLYNNDNGVFNDEKNEKKDLLQE